MYLNCLLVVFVQVGLHVLHLLNEPVGALLQLHLLRPQHAQLILQGQQLQHNKNKNKADTNDGGQRKSNKEKKNNTKTSTVKIEKTKDVKVIKLQEQIDVCKSLIKNATLHDIFIPNKLAHKKRMSSRTKLHRAGHLKKVYSMLL